uniref:Uncharacterized protein n=1 Tax=Spongospora subterranea TaxID=70186 RepID=A0A0H5QRF8_9EUKA|eukprot:CRZ04091.1 hypothetical protein [Spongospora subterranea]
MAELGEQGGKFINANQDIPISVGQKLFLRTRLMPPRSAIKPMLKQHSPAMPKATSESSRSTGNQLVAARVPAIARPAFRAVMKPDGDMDVKGQMSPMNYSSTPIRKRSQLQ